MQPSTIPTQPVQTWQEQLSQSVTSITELLQLLSLKPADVGYSEAASMDFPLKVPHSFVRRMTPGNPGDPLLRQVLPLALETAVTPGYTEDPVGEVTAHNPLPGVLHKYHGRVLLIVTAGCAVHCRYCFRRHFPYQENRNTRSDWQATLKYIAQDESINEVILSGGDPLVASDTYLANMTSAIANIGHIKRLRIHSRLPIVLPDRVTNSLVEAITHPLLQTILVAHSNHANEIDHTVHDAFQQLRNGNITLLNQAVLLADINDTVAAQIDLQQTLFSAGVLPYYLHILDKVRGAAHFDKGVQEALELHKAMQMKLPGYLVPRLVCEEQGAAAKTLVY